MDEKAGLCPSGHGILIRARAPVGDGFYLDRCAACFGVWFDQGEWQVVSAAGLKSGLFELWTGPWRRQQRQNARHANEEDRLRERVGAELAGKLEDLAEQLRQHPARDLALSFLHDKSRS